MKHFTFSNVYAYTYTHIITINGKRGHAFEKEQGGVYWGVWRKERRNVQLYYNLKNKKYFFQF